MAPLFRKAFSIDKVVKRAKVFISGLGYFELYTNGHRIGNDFLVPNFTNYTERPHLKNCGIALDGNFRNHRVLYLSYDITYLLPWIIEEWGMPEILAVDTHKVLQVTFGGFILKCSYILSNMSLNLWSEKLHTTIRKKVGTVDYDAIHYQDSILTEKDDIYMVGDVECLAECISKTLDNDGDTLLTIPLTSTGYVRRDCRKSCRNE